MVTVYSYIVTDQSLFSSRQNVIDQLKKKRHQKQKLNKLLEFKVSRYFLVVTITSVLFLVKIFSFFEMKENTKN